MESLQALPAVVWVMIPALLLVIIYFTVSQNLYKAAQRLGLALIGSTLFWYWYNYLDNHFIGQFNTNGLPSNFTTSAWSLLLASWPLWLPIAFGVATATSAITKHYKVHTDSESSDDASMGFHQPGSEEMIKIKFENERLHQQLRTTQKKLKLAKNSRKTVSSKETRTILSIKELRGQLVECKRAKTSLCKEVTALNSDLERTNHLVDQLLEEKYGPDE
jgi:signal transduction histidine kinase